MIAKFNKDKNLVLIPQSHLEEIGLKIWIAGTGETKDDVVIEKYFDIDEMIP